MADETTTIPLIRTKLHRPPIVRDQAELSGVLNTLYELHLSLLWVDLSDNL